LLAIIDIICMVAGIKIREYFNQHFKFSNYKLQNKFSKINANF